jgi:hypothetical protein
MRISDFAAIAVVTGILALVGLWDNERTIRRNLDAGYDASATVSGAHEQHRAPLTFDGLRPRFIDETYSVDLTWRGRDGTEHARQKVPVSLDYMASLADGNKVRLVPIPIKVTDGQEAVPTIVPDVTARIAHIHGLATWAGYGTAAAALVFVINFGGRWWRRNRSAASAAGYRPEPTALHIPPRLLILTIVCLGAAGMFGYSALKDSGGAAAIRARGREANAAITGLHGTLRSDRTVSYTIELAWRDGSGAERRFGPTHISDAYAQRIAPGGVLITRQTAILYLEEDRLARPIIVADANERTFQDGLGVVMIAVFGVAGLVLAVITVRRTRQA